MNVFLNTKTMNYLKENYILYLTKTFLTNFK